MGYSKSESVRLCVEAGDVERMSHRYIVGSMLMRFWRATETGLESRLSSLAEGYQPMSTSRGGLGTNMYQYAVDIYRLGTDHKPLTYENEKTRKNPKFKKKTLFLNFLEFLKFNSYSYSFAFGFLWFFVSFLSC